MVSGIVWSKGAVDRPVVVGAIVPPNRAGRSRSLVVGSCTCGVAVKVSTVPTSRVSFPGGRKAASVRFPSRWTAWGAGDGVLTFGRDDRGEDSVAGGDDDVVAPPYPAEVRRPRWARRGIRRCE